jgi:uncharacterized protein YcfL
MKFKLKNMKKKLLTLLALTTLLLVSCEPVEKIEDVSSSTTVTINLPKGEKFIDLKPNNNSLITSDTLGNINVYLYSPTNKNLILIYKIKQQ